MCMRTLRNAHGYLVRVYWIWNRSGRRHDYVLRGIAMHIGRLALGCAMMVGMLGAAMPSEAQRYYARERIVGLSNQPSYSPVYGPFGSCSSGSRSAPVTGCMAADGAPGPSGSCSQAPKTEACASARTCGSFTTSRWPSTRSDLGFFAAASMADAQPKAKTLCENTTKSGIYCGVTSGYSAAACTNAGVSVPAGNSCYGAVIGPEQALQQTPANYATSTCS